MCTGRIRSVTQMFRRGNETIQGNCIAEQYLNLLGHLLPFFDLRCLFAVPIFQFTTGTLLENVFCIDLCQMTTKNTQGNKGLTKRPA